MSTAQAGAAAAAPTESGLLGAGLLDRIVEESRIGDRQASATARRHGIPISLLFRWRRDFAGVETAAVQPMAFIPVMATDVPSSAGGVSGISCSTGR